MPTVRAYGTRQVQTRALPTVRNPRTPSPEEYGAGLGRAAAEIGFGIAAKAQQQRDEMLLRETTNQLMSFIRQRRDDPQQGWTTARGFLAADLPGIVEGEVREQATRLATDLPKRVQDAFGRALDDRLNQTLEWASQYSRQEVTKADAAGHEAFINNTIANSVAAAHDTNQFQRGRDELIAEVHDYGRRQGAGPEVLAFLQTSALTKLHGSMLDRYLALGADQAATVYYGAYRDEIAGDARAEIEVKLDTASTAGVALRAAEALWADLGPRTDGDPIHLDTMETAARARFADDPKILDATIHRLRERKAGVDASRREREEALVGGLWTAVSQGASLEDLRRTPAYLAAPGRVQAQLSDYIVGRAEREANRAAAVESRAWTREQRAAARQEQEGWHLYWNYSRPDVLAQMTEPQILALMPVLGDAHVGRLLTKHREYAKGGDVAVRAATINQQQFNKLADGAGFKPYDPKSDKARLGYLQAAVEDEIDRRQTGKPGTVLTRAEKGKIMQELIDDDVLLNDWFADTRLPAAVVNASEAARAYVPLGEIPLENREEFANFYRSISPEAQRLTTDQILTRAKASVERAYAAVLLRLGEDEVQRRLRGE